VISRLSLGLMILAVALAAPLAVAQVRIGLGGPITGVDAVFGAQMRSGVEQAVEDINAAGGIVGKKLIISIGDDAGDPKQGVAVATKFIGEHVGFVIGHFTSGVTMAASEIYAENNMLDITPSATDPRITERGFEMMFRLCGRDDQQASVAARFLARQSGKRIAILHDKTTYGKGLADELRRNLHALGVTEVLYDSVGKGEKDFSAAVSRIKAADADILYWGGEQTEAGLLIRQMRDQGVNAVLMGTASIASDEFAAIGGPDVEGTFMTFPNDPRNRPEAADLVKKYRARNLNPEAYTFYAYAAVQVIKQAAEIAKSLDPPAVAKAMYSGATFKTVVGDISFDVKGDPTRADYGIFVWKKGQDGKISYYPSNK
jgi:branched-chain amino acid transport system substrate-binding protein